MIESGLVTLHVVLVFLDANTGPYAHWTSLKPSHQSTLDPCFECKVSPGPSYISQDEQGRDSTLIPLHATVPAHPYVFPHDVTTGSPLAHL